MKVRRGFSRPRQALVLLLTSGALAAATTAPSLYDYAYDGKTTYCYWMDQGMQVSNFDFAYVLDEGTGDECPLTVALQQATTGPILAGQEVEYAFTATLNLNADVFNLTALQATVPDPTTGLPMQIGHANIHTCSRSTVCDIFRTGSNRKIADQETSNFTSAGTASFRQKITYSSAGERNVFAHVILPPADFLKESYHFITFITTTVEASTTSASDESSSGLGTGATIGVIIAAAAIVVAVVLSVVFWRRRRRPNDTDHFRSSGFGLPASYVASKSKSHLDWNAEPEARVGGTSNGSGWKDNYSAGDRSRGSRGPMLNASALAFNDRLSRQNQTVSSSGSMPSMHSSRGPGDSGLYNDFSTPTIMQRSANFHGSRSGRLPNDNLGASDLGASKALFPDESVYDDDGESRIIEEDPNMEYGRTPDLETFGIHNGQGPSFESETSMGTSFEYNTADNNYAQPTFNPLLSGYDRESDLSSLGETEEYNMYEHPPPRVRGETMDAMLAADDNEDSDGEIRASASSIGTVDFTQDEPSVRARKLDIGTLDETLTFSGYAKSQAVAAGEFATSTTSTDFASTNSSDNAEFVIHDSSTNFAATDVSSDLSSTVTTSEIDVNSNFNFGSSTASSDYVNDIGTTDFSATSNTDIISEVPSTEFDASSNADFTSGIGSTEFGVRNNEEIAKSSEFEGSSFNSDLVGSSYNSDMVGSSYNSDMVGSSYGTDSFNNHLDDSELGTSTKDTALNIGHGDGQSFRMSDSFATTTSEDTTTTAGTTKTNRTTSDGKSYEF